MRMFICICMYICICMFAKKKHGILDTLIMFFFSFSRFSFLQFVSNLVSNAKWFFFLNMCVLVIFFMTV